ncbi:hypothetical protein [Aquabacter sediminis]|uniref:hypothetical protein n=1 Tax=Aquabacter sediminis TaxID=3029197 RepID=UPI00237E66A5|nr:hypothetical protein [Aquabacter sp. P-9]MDE1569456.1 hypothetical protein [Aquabacter sp. P-9]
MQRDSEQSAEASAEAPEDAAILSDASAEAAAGGVVANLGEFQRNFWRSTKKVDEPATPTPHLGPSFAGAYPVQLSGSIPFKEE